MKNIILTFIILGIVFSSCDEQLDINRDPDALAPSQLALNVELPAGITGIAGVQGAYWAIIGGIWSQFWSQSLSSSQYRVVDNYTLGVSDPLSTDSWTEAYDTLLDLRNVKKNAELQENWNYYLIATVLETYISQMITDWYGDIPYTEANTDILQPAFNTGQEVYDLMIVDLNNALSKNLEGSLGSEPGNDDLIFNGNMGSWIQFANTLKLKIYLRQTEARSSVASAGINSLLNSGANFLTSDASVTGFTDAPNVSNPLYETDRRQLNTTQNLRASTTMHGYLTDNDDIRIPAFYGAGDPLDQGDYNSTAAPNSISVANLYPETDVLFISLEESLLMHAEALERYKGGVGAKALYDEAIMVNFTRWELDPAGYTGTGEAYEYPSGTFDDKLEAIITQKWIAGYPGNGAEAFFEHNRTGYPKESSVTQQDPLYIPGEFAYSVNGVTGFGNFPQRLIYPPGETEVNANAPAIVPITTNIWWNK